MKKNIGFTLAELFIVVTIVLILAAVALGGVSGTLRNLRFGNAFNKMIFMVQQGRGLASTGRDSAVAVYIVQFNFTASDPRAITIKQKLDNTLEEIDRLILDPRDFQFFAAAPCNQASVIVIQFTNGKAATQLLCDNVAQSLLTIGLQETRQAGNSKTFSIHQASGVPQVQ